MPTTYTTIPDSQIDGESPVTVALMTALRDNPIAITEGASGAPKIQAAALDAGVVTEGKIGALAVTEGKIGAGAVTEGKIGASAVSQGKLKTTTITAGGTVVAAASGPPVVPGEEQFEFSTQSQYMFYPQTYCNLGGAYDAQIAYGASNTSAKTLIFFRNYHTSDQIILATARYVQSSPPYDLGDGDVPLFAYAKIDDKGKVKSISLAEDPPWAYMGPHSATPDTVRDGKKFKRVSRLPFSYHAAKGNPKKLAEFMAAMRAGEADEVEITREFKNRDMHLRPFPHLGKGEGDIVLIDPVSRVIEDLAQIHREAGSEAAKLLFDGYVELTGEVQRHGPPGVKVMGIRWRNHG